MKLPFNTTPEEQLEISKFHLLLKQQNFLSEFIDRICEIAKHDQGTFEILKLWHETVDESFKNDLVGDMNQAISDWDGFSFD